MFRSLPIFMAFFVALPAFAASSSSQARRSVASQMVMSAPRATASTNQLEAMSASNSQPTINKIDLEEKPSEPIENNRDKEKEACVNNNVGLGNTFVWASRYSDSNNYMSMIEDVIEPDNNVCFVRVELKSNDSKISLSDIPARYFEMGRIITCGEWANEDTVRQRILDARKNARVWGSVGAAVGGAAIGVGAMELFGNSLIGGKVEGQNNENLSNDEVLLSQLLVLKNDKDPDFDKFIAQLKIVKEECAKLQNSGGEVPEECSKYNYEYLLNANN